MKNSASLHPHSKHLALDGRLRSLPDAEKDRYCSLFFSVSRCEHQDDARINMAVEYCKLDMTISGHMPGMKGQISVEKGHTDLPAIPVMVNPKKARARVAQLLLVYMCMGRACRKTHGPAMVHQEH